MILFAQRWSLHCYFLVTLFAAGIAQADEIKEAFTNLAVGKVLDARKKNSRKSYANIPIMIEDDDNDSDTSIPTRLRSVKGSGPSLSERIGSEQRGQNFPSDFSGGHALWGTPEEDEHSAAVSAALEAASEAAGATARHEKGMKARLDQLETRIDTELGTVNRALSQITRELARLSHRSSA